MSDMWNPPMMCPDCKAKLQSKYPGEFAMCDCPTACFVDQGKELSRAGGSSPPIPWEEPDEEDV